MPFSTPIAHAIAGSTDNRNVTTSGVDTSGANFIVIAVADIAGGGYTLSDSKGNTFTFTGTEYAVANGNRIRCYYKVNPTVGSAHTFTVSGLTGNIFPSIQATAFSGAKISSPFDQQIGATNGSSSTLATGSITPGQADELIITAVAGGSSTGAAYSVDSGFTLIDGILLGSGLHFGLAVAYKIQTAAAAVNPTWTQGTTTSIADTVFSFKPQVKTTEYRGFFKLRNP